MSKRKQKLDTSKKTYTTRAGVTLYLKGVPPLFFERLMNERGEEPQPPLVDVDRAGQIVQEPDPNDPAYKAALARFRAEREYKISYFTLTMGVTNQPPQEWLDECVPLFPDKKPGELKYLYITSLLDDQEEIEGVVETIVGMTMPTEEGVAEAENDFRPEGQ